MDAAVVVQGGRIAQVTTIDAWRRGGDPDLHSHVLLANKVQGPDGRWLSSMPRRRLSAEELRDAILAVSGQETRETQQAYGVGQEPFHEYARQCLLARRCLEAGVRFVQVNYNYPRNYWDAHGDLRRNHSNNALKVDRPVAALLRDLKRRGLFEDTLVIFGMEFGRTPAAQGTNGRYHRLPALRCSGCRSFCRPGNGVRLPFFWSLMIRKRVPHWPVRCESTNWKCATI